MSCRGGPQRVEEYVQHVYWTCNVFGHRHRDEPSARLCMAKRKGEIGELKKLRRHLGMLADTRAGMSQAAVGQKHACSDSNVIKSINALMLKAHRLAGSSPYPLRNWNRFDLVSAPLQVELDWAVSILHEHEAKLAGLAGDLT